MHSSNLTLLMHTTGLDTLAEEGTTSTTTATAMAAPLGEGGGRGRGGQHSPRYAPPSLLQPPQVGTATKRLPGRCSSSPRMKLLSSMVPSPPPSPCVTSGGPMSQGGTGRGGGGGSRGGGARTAGGGGGGGSEASSSMAQIEDEIEDIQASTGV